MKNIILTLFLALPFSAFSQTCSEINLVTQKESPFQKIPVYDQDSLGTCYAYSTSQLADYYLMSNKKKTEPSVSPHWLALKYSNRFLRSGITGGTIGGTIEALREDGYCDSKDSDKLLHQFAKKGGMSDAEFLGILEDYFELYEMSMRSKKSFNETNLKVTGALNPKFVTKTRKLDLFRKASSRLSQKYCPANGHFAELEKAISGYLDLPTTYFLNKLAALDCPSPKKNLVPPPTFFSPKKNVEVEQSLIKTLSNNKPVGIGYCARIWWEPKTKNILTRAPKLTFWNEKQCGTHASVVVGMKPLGNKCQFLVRNSWGNGFSDGNSQYKCLCKNKKTKAYVDDCTKKTHSNKDYSVEGCWVSGEALSTNVMSTTSI